MTATIGQRKLSVVIHHSDQGSRQTSVAFGLRCMEACVWPSMGPVCDGYDNAMRESLFATLECELLERRKFRTKVDTRMAISEFIEGRYKPRRRPSALGFLLPIDHERSALETLEFSSP